MKKTILLSFLFILSSYFLAMAQVNFGLEVNGVYFTNGSTLSIGCLSGNLEFKVVGSQPITGYHDTDNSKFYLPSGWRMTLAQA